MTCQWVAATISSDPGRGHSRGAGPRGGAEGAHGHGVAVEASPAVFEAGPDAVVAPSSREVIPS